MTGPMTADPSVGHTRATALSAGSGWLVRDALARSESPIRNHAD